MLYVGSIMVIKLVVNEFVVMIELKKVVVEIFLWGLGIFFVFLVFFVNFVFIGIVVGVIKGLNE